MSTLTPTIIFLALLGGLIPAVFWLWFWLKEDRLHPEPRALIFLAFLAGMLATALAYPIEKFIASGGTIFGHEFVRLQLGDLTLLFLWAVTEEILKFAAIYIVALRTKYFDEPIDAVIYLITIALGFAALENTLFLFNPLGDGDALATILLGNFRFVGATLLHVVASAIVGVSFALVFYEARKKRILAGLIGLCLAIALHTLFNFSIIITEGQFLNQIFVGLWVMVIGILLLCERIKSMAPRSHVLFPHTGVVINLPHNHISQS